MTLVSKETLEVKRRWPLQKVQHIIYPLYFPVSILVLWQLAGTVGLVEEHILPTPLKIASTFWILLANGELPVHFLASGQRVIFGFLLGALTAIILGIATGFSKIAQQLIDPSLQMLRTVPLLSLIPLFILWFGVGEFGKVLMIALGAFFPVYVNIFLGIRLVDQKLYEVTGILQYSFKEKLTKLIFPSAMPNLLLGLRLAMGTSWLVLVVSEMMGASAGIGYMIQDARAYSQTDIVFVGLILFIILGKFTDSLVGSIEKRALKWRDTYKG